MAERTVSVRLTAKIDAYRRAMREASRSTDEFAKGSGKSIQKLGTDIGGVGRKMMPVTIGLGALGLGAAKAAIDWESAWAGVTKTVDGTSGQLERLEGDLRAMALELPATHTEIAAVAEAAGQLGVETDSIASFTETMIALGETTNLTAEEAATALARFGTIMGTADADVERVASTIVELGNNSATTEAEIVEMSTRLAAAGKIAGLSESDVLAFASTLTSVGVNAEAGGTALSKVFISIRDAVLTGSAELETFAETAGVSTSEFKTAFETDAAGAIALFIDGLGRMNESGLSTTGVFDDLSLTDQRLMRSLLSVGEAQGLLTEQLDMGRDAWIENDALAEEAGKRYETTGAQFEIFRNKIVDLGIVVGGILVPVLTDVVDFATELIEIFQGLPSGVQTAIVALGGVAAVLGPMLIVIGSVIRAWGTLKLAMTGMTLSNPALLALAGIATGAALAIEFFGDEAEVAQAKVGNLAEQVSGVVDPIKQLGTFIADTAQDNQLLLDAMDGAGVTVGEYATALLGISEVSVDTGLNIHELYNRTGELTEGQREAVIAYQDLYYELVAAGQEAGLTSEQFELLMKTTGEVTQESIGFVDEQGKLKTILGDTATETDGLTGAYGEQSAATSTLVEDTFALAEGFVNAADETNNATLAAEAMESAISELSSALADSIGDTINLQRAEDNWIGTMQELDEIVYKANAGVEGFTTSLDPMTEAGRENREAMRLASEEILGMSAGLLESGASAAEAEGRMLDMRGELVAQLQQWGLTKDEANAYLDALDLTPEEIRTQVELSGVEAAEANLANLSRDRNVTVWVNEQVGNVVRRGGGSITERDGGGFGMRGDLVAERRPEFVGGELFTSPTLLARPAMVTSGASTERKIERMLAALESGDRGGGPLIGSYNVVNDAAGPEKVAQAINNRLQVA